MSENPRASDKRFVRWAVLLSALAMLAVIAGVCHYVRQRPLQAAEDAKNAALAADFEQMQTALDKLETLDRPELYYDTVLDCARLADYHGRQELALALLSQPRTDEDAYAAFAETAQELTAMVVYHQALGLYESGDYARAARMAVQADGYEPARALYELAQAAYQASLPTPQPTPVSTPVPTPEPAAASEPTPQPEAFSLLPPGRLAAGFAHTVVLLEDGTVRAFGDNSHGQLEVSGWRDVVWVACGAYHTLGLTSDGRVLACGDNTCQQTEVSFYTGVRAIAAGDYASFLLLESGQVMATGYLSYDFLDGLPAAQAVWAGSYGLLVQTADGLQASHPGIALQADCCQIAVSRGYAVGVDAQGVTHSITALVPQWTGVAFLSAGENAVLALTQDGRVLSHVFDRHSRYSLSFSQPVLAAAAGPNHCAFLTADGALEIRYSDGRSRRHQLN